ncbi:MAG TPA: biopolymer transporter ExbD [Candidatus Sumerlaeota bacterium]|nr:biopolymer transporter ExbD [Candidatus Sumerlaeota bacterium]HOR28263.1 biopolymer transporter ExbD [Candidatus Sumerlaeota bacterium]HPK03316.1 biopolymer transporter ExbD [Candidatus Sumerlaeota bacterium]
MRRHRRDLEVLSDMNLTNLLDTAFILLMAFMLVAPMLKTGIDLNLPRVGAGQLQGQQKTVTISIAKPQVEGQSERIYVDDARVTYEELEEKLAETKSNYQAFSVAIEADAEATYQSVARVLSLLKAMQITSVGLVTDPAASNQQAGSAAAPEPEDQSE